MYLLRGHLLVVVSESHKKLQAGLRCGTDSVKPEQQEGRQPIMCRGRHAGSLANWKAELSQSNGYVVSGPPLAAYDFSMAA